MPFVFLQWSISLLIAGVASRRLVPAQRRGDYLWLGGAHPEFLKQLPQWTYNGAHASPR
jgi:hypothetical protein